MGQESFTGFGPLLDLLFEDSHAGRCLVAPDGKILRANQEWLRATGLLLPDILGVDVALLHVQTRDVALSIEEHAGRGDHVDLPRHSRCIEGGTSWWDGRLDPVPMEGGGGLLVTLREVKKAADDAGEGGAGPEPSGLAGTRRLEGALGESEQRFRLALRNTPVSLAAQDRELRYVWAYNHRSVRSEDLLGKLDADLFKAEEAERLGAIKRRVLSEGLEQREQMWLDRPSGRMYLDIFFEPIRDDAGQVMGVATTTVDLTPMRVAQDALQESEQRFSAIYDHAPYAIALIGSPEGSLVAVNGAWERMFGYSREEALGQTSVTLGLATDLDGLRRMYAEILGGGSVQDFELEYTTKAGDRRLGAFSFQLVNIGGRRFHLGTVLDVTDRKRAEAELRQSEERFHALIDKSTDLIVVLDGKGQYRFWSQGAMATLGWTPEEKLGQSALEMIHPDDHPRMAQVLEQLMSRPDMTSLDLLRYRHKDGSWRQIEATARNLLGVPAVAGVVVNGRDITAQRGLEEQLRQAQKLESVGRLAGGVAHDFNNLLTVILSCAESLDEALSSGRPASVEEVRDIRAAGKRAGDLTHQLLAFARKQVVAPVPLDLGALVREGKKMLARLLGEDIRMEMKLEPDLWTIEADPGQVTQVLVNLSVNARDAMPAGGRLFLETSNVENGPEEVARDPDRQLGEWVRLVLRDSGVGMTSEVTAHLFEPFYTTKEQGKGTGLGLATVYGIVKQAGGHVHVKSVPGEGTTFEVCFPRAQGDPAPASQAVAAVARKGTERVLVVEDDAQVRAVTVRTLQAAGYDVQATTGAQEALDLPREECGKIRLLITDVVMPGINGHALAEEMRRRHPGLRVLYLSGYTQEIIAARGVVAPGIELLAKPFTGPTLLARVRRILDAPE